MNHKLLSGNKQPNDQTSTLDISQETTNNTDFLMRRRVFLCPIQKPLRLYY